MFGLANPLGILRLIGGLLTVAALAFGVYVALDQDLRTLAWDKWNGNVPYEWPGGNLNFSVKVDVQGK